MLWRGGHFYIFAAFLIEEQIACQDQQQEDDQGFGGVGHGGIIKAAAIIFVARLRSEGFAFFSFPRAAVLGPAKGYFIAKQSFAQENA